MANCVGYLGYDLIHVREPVAIAQDVLHWPARQFRDQLLLSKLKMMAKSEGKTLDQYIDEQSSHEAAKVLMERHRRFREAIASQPDDEGTSDIVKAAKVDPRTRGRLRWNG